MSSFYINFGSNLPPFWQPWTPQIDLILTPLIDPMDSNPDKNGTSYRISLQDRFLVDFGSSKTSPRPLQGRSRRLKTAPKRCQDASKIAQDASGHVQDGFRRCPNNNPQHRRMHGLLIWGQPKTTKIPLSRPLGPSIKSNQTDTIF